MLQLLRFHRERDNKKATVIKWYNSDIPARIFFGIMFNQIPLTELGNAEPNDLETTFDKIVDEFVELDDNSAIVQWYKKRCKIGRIAAIIELVEMILYHICTSNLTTEERLESIEELNRIEEKPETKYSKVKLLVKFDINKPFWEEINRVQNVVLGQLRTELKFLLLTEKKEGNNVKYSFEKELVSIENVLGRAIDDNVSLKKYIHLKKSAELKAKPQPKSYKNGK
jgi:hypothetical protein